MSKINFYLSRFQVRHKYGLYDEITSNPARQRQTSQSSSVRHCNWVRFLRVASDFGPHVNLACARVRGEPIYEAVKNIAAGTELVVYYLPDNDERTKGREERLENGISRDSVPDDDAVLVSKMRNAAYRRTMDSILEG